MTDGGNGSRSHYFALPAGSKLYEFEIEAVLGHGGFGITYRAIDTLLQETVAIKEFLPNEVAVRITDATVQAKSERDRPDFETGLKSFLEEARVMARFRHPRIVHVRRFFELHGTGYIVLDYERGQTLSDHLNEGTLPQAELVGILSGVLDGLEVIHDRAILHRDLKPNNIMLREDSAPVIIDFGAARDFQARHSRSVTAIATAGYAPPEQYGVGTQQGPWSDLYALGAIAYRAVSGVTPIDSLRRLRNDPLVPAVTAGAGKYDEELLRTIDWMLKIDEVDRPASVAQVREVLRGGPVPVAEQDTSPSISDNGRMAAPPPSRRAKMAAVAGLLILAGLAAGSYALYVNYQARQQAELQAKQQAEHQTQQAKERQDQQLAQQLGNAGTDQSKLEQFLAACGPACPDTLRSQAQALIGTKRQQLLAEQLASIGKDQSKLQEFLAACGPTCPDALRAHAQVRIDTAKQEQRQAELAREDEASYRAARGDIAKLRDYDTACTMCSFRNDARSEIASIEQQQVQLASQQTLGLDLMTLSMDLRTRYRIKDSVKGVVVTKVDGTSEAAEKRLSPGDVIVEVAQEPVSSAADIKNRVGRLRNDGKKSVLLLVANADGTLRFVALDNSKTSSANRSDDVIQQQRQPELVHQQGLGLDLVTLSKDLRTRYRINDSVKGVVITSVDGTSDAAEKRLSPGDVIVEVAQEPVSSAADVNKHVERLRNDGKKSVLLLVANADGELRFVALDISRIGGAKARR